MTEYQKNLGELELLVLKVVWEAPASSVQEIVDIVRLQRNCARTTVLTVMQRLHAKRFLKRRKVRGVFRYSHTKDRGKVLSGLIGRFVDKMLDGSSAPFLSYLAASDELTEEQSEQLRTIVEELELKEKERSDG